MLISGPDAALMHTFVQGMGHLLGLRFASSTFNAYGDVADWMSNGIVGSVATFGVGFLDRLGWLPRCRGGSEWPQTDSAVFDVSGSEYTNTLVNLRAADNLVRSRFHYHRRQFGSLKPKFAVICCNDFRNFMDW